MALSDPGKINAATVQDVKRCLELLGELEARLPKEKEESRDKALSPENAQAIRKSSAQVRGRVWIWATCCCRNQKAWLGDKSPVKVGEKSRRIGLTWRRRWTTC